MKQCQPKVAICISGAVRGNFKVCFDSIYDKLVKPLDADVFISTWDNYYSFNGYQNTGASFIGRILGSDVSTKASRYIHENFVENFFKTYSKLCSSIVKKITIDDFFNSYRINELEIVSEDVFNNNFEKIFDTSGYFNFNQYKMFFLMFKCNDLMHRYELSVNKSYDIVIRIRPDCCLLSDINLDKIKNLQDNQILSLLFTPGPDDAFFCASSKTMDKITDIWNYILLSKKLSPFKNIKGRSHGLLAHWCLKNGIAFNSISHSETSSIVSFGNPLFSLQKCVDESMPYIRGELVEDLKLLFQKDDLPQENKELFFNFANIICSKYHYEKITTDTLFNSKENLNNKTKNM